MGYNSDMNITPAKLLSVSLTIVFASPCFAQRPVDPSRFLAPQPRVYTLDEGDTLGVFVEGVVGEQDSNPPINYPPDGSSLGPAMGFPTLVLHDATIRLPNVDAISVKGLTVSQVESLLKRLYRDGENPIISEQSRVIVSLVRKRTVNVTVIRGDQSQARSNSGSRFNTGPVAARSDGSASIVGLNLPAGENDLLNAMVQSGGLPGVNAENQLQVFRTAKKPIVDPRFRNGAFPRSGETHPSNSTSFPIRTDRQASLFPRSSAQLNNGDIVAIASKPTEVFYTGGLLGGGEFRVPRDRALSVMDAVALSGGIPQSQRGGIVPNHPPRVLRLLRTQNGRQLTFRFDLSGGYSQQAANTQVRAGDYLILDYSRAQRVQNLGTGVLDTVGVRQLFGN